MIGFQCIASVYSYRELQGIQSDAGLLETSFVLHFIGISSEQKNSNDQSQLLLYFIEIGNISESEVVLVQGWRSDDQEKRPACDELLSNPESEDIRYSAPIHLREKSLLAASKSNFSSAAFEKSLFPTCLYLHIHRSLLPIFSLPKI
jgi:hypothetical protein